MGADSLRLTTPHLASAKQYGYFAEAPFGRSFEPASRCAGLLANLARGVSHREDGLVPLADMALAQKSAGAEIPVEPRIAV